ncbi:MAG: hypothetical protein WC527_04115 [Candidatus Margulisiibacteriota bacterium]
MVIAQKLFALFVTPLGIHTQKLLLALLLIIASFLAAKLAQIITVYILDLVNADKLSEKIKLRALLKKTELGDSFSQFGGDLVFWLALIFGGIKIIYLLQLNRALEILRAVLSYVTVNVVSAVFILVLSVIFASLLSGIILFVGGLINLPGYKFIARVNQYVVVIFGIVMGLEKLGIAASVFLARPDIILGFFALAGAIAFGLGCKDMAENFLANFLRNSR